MMCFRLKSSPPKKTLRLRCFFFMAPVPGLNREAAPRTNQFIRVFRRSRKQLERVLRWPGQEGRRVPADPGLVACAEIGGERIGALAPRHVENALLLVSRGDDEALARSVRGFLDARHVRIPGEGIGGHAQPEGRPARQAAGERGLPLHPVVLAPGGAWKMPSSSCPGETTKRSLAPCEGSWTRGMCESPGRGSAHAARPG